MDQTEGVFVFPHEFAFWMRVQNHDAHKNTLTPLIENHMALTKDKHVGHWACDVNTEFFGPHLSPKVYEPLVVDAIYPAFDRLFKALPIRVPKNGVVTKVWYNVYEPGSYQEMHNHIGENSSVCAVYMLELQEENPLRLYSNSAGSGLTASTSTKHLKEVTEGCVVMFPPNMSHYVAPCKKRRITIAFNIRCEMQ